MTRLPRAALALTLVLAGAGLTACREEAKADPIGDQKVVARVVLQPSDIPEGWARIPFDGSDGLHAPLNGCLGPQGMAPTAHQTSDRYSAGWLQAVFSEAVAWPEDGMAHASLVTLTTDSFDACVTDAIKGYLASVNIKFVSSGRDDVLVPQRGDGAVRYARTFVIEGADGKRSEVSLDVMRVRRDHFTVTSVHLGAIDPLTDVTGRDFVDVMLNRIKV